MKTEIGYSHHLNSDGTVDSICLFCCRKVATDAEAELAALEATHHCDDIYFEARRQSVMRRRESSFDIRA